MSNSRIGLLGARSLVGQYLIELLADYPVSFMALTRKIGYHKDSTNGKWKQFSAKDTSHPINETACSVPHWICMLPIWVLPNYFALMEAHCVRKVVVVSSTSLFTKDRSSGKEEQTLAKRVHDAEKQLIHWSVAMGGAYEPQFGF